MSSIMNSARLILVPALAALVTIAAHTKARAGAEQERALPEGTIQVPAGSGAWIEAPPSLPAGTRMMLLEGHPGQKGFFTMRLRLPAGSRIQPHWHPSEERVTILSGVARVGFGDSFDERRMATFEPGSFYLNPAKSHHYVWIVEQTEMQLTGMGPWELHLLEAR